MAKKAEPRFEELYALIMAGGRGARFWPRSRKALPKQCVALTSERSLLQETVDRLLPLIPAERILVVTGPDMAAVVREQLPEISARNILIEPSPRNTAPCIGLGLVEVGRRGGSNAVMAVLPADHMIGDPPALRRVLVAAARAAHDTNALIALGLQPTRAETGYGYLEVGAEMGQWGGHRFHMVERFTEKPDAVTARSYLEDGQHLWNAGMFVFTVAAARDAFRNHLPATAEALAEIQRRPAALDELWTSTDHISIDYGIMERSRHLLTVPCELGWSDVGSWESVAELLPMTEGSRALAEHLVSVDAADNIVHAPHKLVALIGVRDLVVVDTGDVLMVMRRGREVDLRQLLDHLEAADLGRFT